MSCVATLGDRQRRCPIRCPYRRAAEEPARRRAVRPPPEASAIHWPEKSGALRGRSRDDRRRNSRRQRDRSVDPHIQLMCYGRFGGT